MKQVLILVEGQTEERFVKSVLYDYLLSKRVCVVPTVLTTKRVKTGSDFKGGVTSYGKAKREIARLLGNTNASLVTTMFDFYALPKDFPGRTNAAGSPLVKVAHVEQALYSDINHLKFYPYLSLHEFEGLLFSEPSRIARALHATNKADDLQRIRNGFTTPEDINDDPNTAPSRRIINILPAYGKVFHGALIAQRIGLFKIREECPHFNEWLTKLESL